MSNVIIELTFATLEDALPVAQIHVAAWRAAYQNIIPTAYLAALSVDDRAARWRSAISENKQALIVAKIEAEVVGWISLGPCRDAGALATQAEIWALYVSPDYWGEGIGTALWQYARDLSLKQGYESVSLWVLSDNVGALRFYESIGMTLDLTKTEQVTIGGKSLNEVCFLFFHSELARFTKL